MCSLCLQTVETRRRACSCTHPDQGAKEYGAKQLPALSRILRSTVPDAFTFAFRKVSSDVPSDKLQHILQQVYSACASGGKPPGSSSGGSGSSSGGNSSNSPAGSSCSTAGPATGQQAGASKPIMAISQRFLEVIQEATACAPTWCPVGSSIERTNVLIKGNAAGRDDVVCHAAADATTSCGNSCSRSRSGRGHGATATSKKQKLS